MSALQIKRDYHAHAGNYRAGGNCCRYIVIHYTCNSASARNEARYASNDQHMSSYHFVLDGIECFQLLDETDTAYAVGAWAGATQIIGNAESISIEVCNAGGPFSEDEIAQLEVLVPLLMQKHGIPAERVVRHYDCHTGHKMCPEYYSGTNNLAWVELRKRICGGDSMTPNDVWAFTNNETRGTAWALLKAIYENTTKALAAVLRDSTGRADNMGINTRFSHYMNKWDARNATDDERFAALDAKLDNISEALGIALGEVKLGGSDE